MSDTRLVRRAVRSNALLEAQEAAEATADACRVAVVDLAREHETEGTRVMLAMAHTRTIIARAIALAMAVGRLDAYCDDDGDNGR